MIQDWSIITLGALQNLWGGFLILLPKIIGAIIVFIIGWFISIWIGKIITEILKRLGVDKIFEKTKWQEALAKAELKTSISGAIGGLIKWILIIVFLMVVIEILGISQFAVFMRQIVIWLPNLVVAVAIFVVAVILADLAEKFIRTIVEKMGVGYTKLAGLIVRWAIWIFAIFAILIQLGIAKELIQTLLTGIIAFIVISCGIAFGLGGKDVAHELLEDLKEKFKK